jgi:hypothetical protein
MTTTEPTAPRPRFVAGEICRQIVAELDRYIVGRIGQARHRDRRAQSLAADQAPDPMRKRSLLQHHPDRATGVGRSNHAPAGLMAGAL